MTGAAKTKAGQQMAIATKQIRNGFFIDPAYQPGELFSKARPARLLVWAENYLADFDEPSEVGRPTATAEPAVSVLFD